uniref:Uncharacterized protein n=1 Tax=Ornithodoros turicata TaxID=34597 RepID=A0A2R5LBV6_9ACAR
MARVNVIRSCGNMKLYKFLLFFNVLDIVYKVVQSVDGQAQGFIQTEDDINQVADGVLAQISEHSAVSSSSPISFSDLDDSNLNMYASPISFEPPLLDFRDQPLSIPIRRKVVVKNLSPESSIEMLSISGSTVHFHCSFFQEKRISPGANTSFDIVYLGRQQGLVENILFIHTSLGSFKYQVSAFGRENPYRLRPFIGARVPLNGTYTPLIYMHNPHSSTIQLTEVYTSGGDLHLEVPDDENEATKDLWEIPPYETKVVMRANFVSRTEKNHTAYICIKTNRTTENSLIVPVEVEVVSIPGIYSPTEVLEFGVVHSEEEPKTLPISLLNSGPKHIHIVNVFVTPVNEALEVKFTPTKVPPNTVHSTQIATVTYIPSRTRHRKQCSGKIVVKSKNNQHKLTIPFQVSFINGSLKYNVNSTTFYIGRAKSLSISDIRPLNISNSFSVPIVIHNVELQPEAEPHFTVIFNSSAVLLPQETRPVAYLQFHPADSSLQLSSRVRLHTNLSSFEIPLSCYSGKLKVHLLHALNNETLLDFGTLGIGHKRTLLFAVINENPVEVVLKHWGSNLTKTYIELVGIEAGNASTLARRYNFSGLVKGLTLKSQHFAVFRVGVTAPEEEGVFVGEAFIETKHEILKVLFTLRAAKGSLTSDPITFENAFPGRVSSQNLYIHSTFSHAMIVTSVYTVPEDPRFYFEVTPNASPELQPRSKNWAGKLYFDPRRDCGRKCYSGLPTGTAEGRQWLSKLSLPKDVGETDLELFKILRERWMKLEESRENMINLTLKVDTSQAQSFLMRAQADLQWPRLSVRCQLKFPVTQVGNLTVKEVTLENPSSLPVLVQVLPLPLYPNVRAVLSMTEGSCSGANVTLPQWPDVFTLQDLEEYDPSPDNMFLAYGKGLEEYFGVQPHRQSLAFQLTPGMRVRLRVGFAPKDDSITSSLLLIRNNLTVMSTLLLKGQGGYGQMRLGNKTPGVDSVLTFELTENHCKDCDGSKTGKMVPPNFTVRRAFTARNTGQLPVYINGLFINDVPCEGYGFHVLNCYSFELKPNSSKRVDIAFTPDFTLTRIERTLSIQTSLGPEPVSYKLVATVPRRFLASCGRALPRPHWEAPIHWCLTTAAVFVILCSIVYALLERDRILQTGFYPFVVSPTEAHTLQPFDLNNIGPAGDSTRQTEKGGGQNKKKESNQLRRLSPGTVELFSTASKGTTTRLDSDIPSKNVRRRSASATTKPKTELQAHPPPLLSQSSEDDVSKPTIPPQTTTRNACSARDSARTSLVQRFLLWFVKTGSKTETRTSVATQTATTKNVHSKDDDERKPRKKKCHVEEETSSTTTETSTSDLSEKDHMLPDVCVSAKPAKSRRSKSKGRERASNVSNTLAAAVTAVEGVTSLIEDTGGDFEVSTRGRSHRKIKVDPRKAFGGDVLRPCTLELPYKPKTVTAETKEPQLNELRLKTQRAAIKFSDVKFKSRSSSFENESESRKSSPPPVWDQPKAPANTDDALAEIARQTEHFALHQHGIKPSRPISYSAAVAGCSTSKAPATTKNATRNCGAVGQKPPGLVDSHVKSEPKLSCRPSQSKMDSLDTFSPEKPPVWHDHVGSKQEIAPLLRNICHRSLQSWSQEEDFLAAWRLREPENQADSVEEIPFVGPVRKSSVDRWGTGTEETFFGAAVDHSSRWDPTPHQVWGSSWWTTPSLAETSQPGITPVDTSPTESMANMVSLLGIDTPDQDVSDHLASFAVEANSTTGTSTFSFPQSIWTQHSAARVTPIGQPWGYSLFQGNSSDAQPTQTTADPPSECKIEQEKPLGWQDKGPI